MGGPYRIVGRIGAGGMAEVFLARAMGVAGFEKDVAIKFIHPAHRLDPQCTAMLIEEARLATALAHANVVQVLDLGQAGDRYYIVMEYIDGADLDSALQCDAAKGGHIPAGAAVYVCREVLNGLGFVHQRSDREGRQLGLVHRDVSPPNILLSRAAEVKLGDFGIAKSSTRNIVTEAGAIRGKVAYMSPEQASGRELDHRSDLFSLGLVLHELLTARQLFVHEDPYVALERVRAAEIPEPARLCAAVPPALSAAVMGALGKDPAARYPDARRFDQALEAAMQKDGLRASRSDLEEWLSRAMPARYIDSVPAAGEVLTFASGQTGTRSTQAQQVRPEGSWRRSVLRGAAAVLMGSVLLAAGLFVAWYFYVGKTPPTAAGTDSILPAWPEPAASRSSSAPAQPPPAAAPAPGAVPATEPKPARPAPATEGILVVNSHPWARILIDGKDTGATTPTVEGLRLRAGRHRLQLVNPELELVLFDDIQVGKGEVVKRFYDLRAQGKQR